MKTTKNHDQNRYRVLLDSARTGSGDWDEPVCQGLLADLERLSR